MLLRPTITHSKALIILIEVAVTSILMVIHHISVTLTILIWDSPLVHLPVLVLGRRVSTIVLVVFSLGRDHSTEMVKVIVVILVEISLSHGLSSTIGLSALRSALGFLIFGILVSGLARILLIPLLRLVITSILLLSLRSLASATTPISSSLLWLLVSSLRKSLIVLTILVRTTLILLSLRLRSASPSPPPLLLSISRC